MDPALLRSIFTDDFATSFQAIDLNEKGQIGTDIVRDHTNRDVEAIFTRDGLTQIVADSKERVGLFRQLLDGKRDDGLVGKC